MVPKYRPRISWYRAAKLQNVGSDTTRFLGMRLVDSSHGSTGAGVLSGRAKIVKRCPPQVTKRSGTTDIGDEEGWSQLTHL